MSGVIKLRFSELGLYGRETELSDLKECFRRVKNGAAGGGGGALEVVLVSGAAGTGKSAIVQKLADDKEIESCAIFVSGKFDDNRASTGRLPYAALRTAFGELVHRVMETYDESDRMRMANEMNEAIRGEGLSVLEKVVPGIEGLAPAAEDAASVSVSVSSSAVDADRSNSAEALNRLKFSLRSFLRFVSSPAHPIILFLDDLQWADQASLALIRSIIDDTQLRHVLFIGAYRDVHEVTHPLSIMLREVEEDASRRSVTRIQLKNLDEPTVTKLIAGLLRMDCSELSELSHVVHQRTGGNAFFVLQFLSMIYDQGLLVYNVTSYQWTWDTAKIWAETNISENVVEFVAQKIQGLPECVATVLKLMACFPSTRVEISFLESVLRGLVMEEFRKVSETSGLSETLEMASNEALIDRIGSHSLKFTHDRIREGAYSLIPAGRERDTLHLRIGEIILDMVTSGSKHQSLKFVAADQLNHGVAYITDEKQKLDLASLNLEAGEMAMSISAFVPAAELFGKGLTLLHSDTNHWKNNYDLSLKLYNLATEAALCNGDFEMQLCMVDEVLANAQCLNDKLPVYCIVVESLTAQQKLEEAMRVGYDVLAQLGERFPKRFLLFNLLADFQKTKRMLRGYSDDDLLSLPPLEDENVIVAIRLMIHLWRCAYFLQRLESMVLLMFRQLQLMLRYGASGDTPYTFASYGMILCGGLGDIKEGCRFGRLALRLLEQYNEQETQVLLLAHSFVVHWQSPVQDQIDPLLLGHKAGMASGDVVNAFLCSVGYIFFYYHSGLPLEPLEKDTRAYTQLMEEYQQNLALLDVIPLYQGILNLMGRSDDALILTGEAMVQDEFLRNAKEKCIPTAIQKVYLVRMQLAYYFGDIDLAMEMLESCEKLMATIKAHMVYEVYTFFCGLIYLEQARRKRMQHYIRKAESMIKKMKRWVKDGAVNCVHKLWLLEAEYDTLKWRNHGQKEKIRRCYDAAISTASRSGLIHDAALANERAGAWCLSHGDEFWASSYLSRAHELYVEWGATAKADQFSQKYKIVVSRQSIEPGHSAKGKTRFDHRSAQQHKSMESAHLSTSNLGSDTNFGSESFSRRRGSDVSNPDTNRLSPTSLLTSTTSHRSTSGKTSR